MKKTCSLVGRERELEFLMDQMASTMSSEGRLVLVAGEAGSGKTTLSEQFLHMAKSSGCQTLVGRCVPGSPTPYLPFMDAFSRESHNPFVLKDTSNELVASKLMLSVLEDLEKLATDRTVILWLEDLHWADSLSISCVHFLARNIRNMRVLILGTYRPEDLQPLKEGDVHPLKGSLRIMRREGVVQELELEPLCTEDTKQIASKTLGGLADGGLLDLIADESEGNPLFTVEISRYMMESGQLILSQGVWNVIQGVQVRIPSSITEVVLARLDRVPKEGRRLLEYSSVIGEWLDPTLIEEGLDLNWMRTLDEIDELKNDHNLIREHEGHYKFSHEKIKQVIYEQISINRRKEFHQSIGYSLEARLPNDELLGPLSYHFDNANENGKCIQYSLSAGKYCSRRKAVKEARSFFQLVLARTDNDDGLIAERLEALEGLGDLKGELSTPRHWYSYYEEFLRLNQDKKARARVLAKASECYDQFGLANTKRANEMLDIAESLAEGDPSILDIIETRRCNLYSNEYRLDEAQDHLAKAKRFRKELGDSDRVFGSRIWEMEFLYWAGRFREAKALAEELRPVALKMENQEMFIVIETFYTGILTWSGEFGLAKRLSSELIELTRKLGTTWWLMQALGGRALENEYEGNFALAIRDYSEMNEKAVECEIPHNCVWSWISTGLCELELGNLESAEHHYEEALQKILTMDSRKQSIFFIDKQLLMLKAELLVRYGLSPQGDQLYEWIISECIKSDRIQRHIETRWRYGRSLARRDRVIEAQSQFDEAMFVAKKMGTEKMVEALARRVGILF
jgi:predicted ATPase